jgi:phage shock protein PspC (stress-responsive transcriptional regulator)
MELDAGSRRKLRRVKGRHWLGGVCAGFGYWLGIPAWMIRVILVLLGFAYGAGVLVYLVLWIFMPAWPAVPEDYDERAGG